MIEHLLKVELYSQKCDKIRFISKKNAFHINYYATILLKPRTFEQQ